MSAYKKNLNFEDVQFLVVKIIARMISRLDIRNVDVWDVISEMYLKGNFDNMPNEHLYNTLRCDIIDVFRGMFGGEGPYKRRFLRSRRHISSFEEDGGYNSLGIESFSPSNPSDIDELRVFMSKLKPLHQKIVKMRLQNYTVGEIGNALGFSKTMSCYYLHQIYARGHDFIADRA